MGHLSHFPQTLCPSAAARTALASSLAIPSVLASDCHRPATEDAEGSATQTQQHPSHPQEADTISPFHRHGKQGLSAPSVLVTLACAHSRSPMRMLSQVHTHVHRHTHMCMYLHTHTHRCTHSWKPQTDPTDWRARVPPFFPKASPQETGISWLPAEPGQEVEQEKAVPAVPSPEELGCLTGGGYQE